MRLPEQRLWDDLRECMGSVWFARRIEDRLGGGVPDVSFAIGKRRGAWMELKVIDRMPAERRIFDIPEFRADQRAFGLQMREHGGMSSWFLMTRCLDVDHLHNASVIDTLGEDNYKTFRNRALWVGRLTDPEACSAIANKLLR